MRYLLSLGSLVLLLIACKKNSDETHHPPSLPEGTYSGTFKRYNITEDKTANITLDFTRSGWTGNSALDKYPALNKGTYKVEENAALVFKNEAPWTADFDWTYILEGMYLLHKNEDSLVFTKSYGNGAVDVFKLARQK